MIGFNLFLFEVVPSLRHKNLEDLIYSNRREKMNYLRKKGIPLFFTLCLVSGLTLGASVAQAHPPHGPKFHKHWFKKHRKHHHKYRYIYYPAAQVYYSPVRRVYYYPYPGGWTFSATLPNRIRLGRGVALELGGPVPYNYHPVVVKQYPVIVVGG